MKREDVEALLVAAQGAGPADPVFGEELFGVEAPTLAALCRAWLAVEDAPVVCAGKSALMGEGWQIYGTDGDSVASLPIESGQRVRLVPDTPTPPAPGHEREGGNG